MFSSFRGLEGGEINGFLLFQLFGIWGGVFWGRQLEVGLGRKGAGLEEDLIILNPTLHFQVTVLCLRPWLWSSNPVRWLFLIPFYRWGATGSNEVLCPSLVLNPMLSPLLYTCLWEDLERVGQGDWDGGWAEEGKGKVHADASLVVTMGWRELASDKMPRKIPSPLFFNFSCSLVWKCGLGISWGSSTWDSEPVLLSTVGLGHDRY